jgi:hypothetical protein
MFHFQKKTAQDAIDLDVQEIEDFIDQDRVIESMLVYEYGGNTRPYALLTVDNPLPEDIEIDSEAYTIILVNETTTTKKASGGGGSFFGTSSSQTTNITTTKEERIYGTVLHKAKKGHNQIHLLYKDPKKCRVGAKMVPILDGCTFSFEYCVLFLRLFLAKRHLCILYIFFFLSLSQVFHPMVILLLNHMTIYKYRIRMIQELIMLMIVLLHFLVQKLVLK